MSLLDQLQEIPAYTGNNWAKYKEAFFFLVDVKNYPPKEAISIIASKEKISKEDETKLYNSSKRWKRIGGSK